MVNISSSVMPILALAATTSTLVAGSPLAPRAVSCLDNLGSSYLANVGEAVECINYLASLGSQACVASVFVESLCRRGNTQISGLLIREGVKNTVTCQQAAQAAGRIMDSCSRGDGKVKGQVDLEFLGTPGYFVDIRTVN
ncbi:hypothetical protein F4805DRAFT_432889 [Annulohypoxylon moriforme]|nr:hypothetical protein F4805DRAFT_432889 [Annulohypoxylon moriforme]